MTIDQLSRSSIADPPEQWALLRGIRWETYEAILNEMENRRVFLTYDHGVLEIMSPSFRHESYAALIGQLIDLLTMELALPIRSGRSTTFRRRELDRGLEPDNCDWIDSEPRVRGKLSYDPAADPPPDLAIEIEVTRRALDRMSIHAALGVPEVWRCDGKRLLINLRQEDGSYAVAPRSRALPMLPPEQVLRFLHLFEEMDETSWKLAFRNWVRAERCSPGSGTRIRGGQSGHEPIPRVEDRAGMPAPEFERLSAELAGLGTMARALAWFASQRPPLAPGGVVAQDEFSFDILVPYRDGLHLAFDST